MDIDLSRTPADAYRAWRQALRDDQRSLVVRHQHWRGRVRRDQQTALQALLEHGLDRAMQEGEIIKVCGVTSVTRLQWQGQDWVLKRYNTRGAGHFLRKQLRRSRARRTWQGSAWLNSIGVATPAPVAYLEQRCFGLLGSAYYICDFVAAPTLMSLIGEPEMVPAEQQVMRFIDAMEHYRFCHGDLKANNFLWQDQRLCVLDLDAMKLQLPGWYAKGRIAKDRARWAKNFRD